MCQNSLCVFFWLIWLSAPSVKFEQAKDNKNDEVRSHHQDHHKKRDATQESTWFSRAVGMYFILEDQDFENNQREIFNFGPCPNQVNCTRGYLVVIFLLYAK